MTTTDSYEGWIGRIAVDRSGDKIGTIADIYYDDATNQPEWVTVKTGLLGTRSSFVPLHGAESDGEHLLLPFDKAQVKDAPTIDTDGSLTPDEERTLYRYYGRGIDVDTDDATAGIDEKPDIAGDEEVTRSEEGQLTGTERPVIGRARLRKHVLTGQESVIVPVDDGDARDEVDGAAERR